MFSSTFRRSVLVFGVLAGTAPFFLVKTHAAPPVKSKVPVGKKAAASKPGTFVEGAGICSFKATFSKGNSNALAAPFVSLNRDGKWKRIVSSSLANRTRTGTSVINLIHGPLEQIGNLRRTRAFSLTLASLGGFRVGQTFKIALPRWDGPPQTQACLMDYNENDVVEREITRPSGRKTTRTTSRHRGWIGVSGTLRVDAVGADGLFFTVKNARFSVPNPVSEQNYAEGAFVLNGKGVCTFNEE